MSIAEPVPMRAAAAVPSVQGDGPSLEQAALRAEIAARCEQLLGPLRARWIPLEAVKRLLDELSTTAARERQRASALAASESELRRELTEVRHRCQDIVDGQMLQLAELKRELERAVAEAAQARAEAEAAKSTAAPPPAAAAPVVSRTRRAPRFDAIEASLAQSPPPR